MGDMAMKTTNMILGLILALCAANTASAQLIINGAGEARDCYLSVKNGDQGRKTTIRDCEQALRNISLSPKDEASTHVNIGILYMRAGDFDKAQASYGEAIDMRPKLSEAYINRAASMIYTGQYQVAIKDANMALELGTDKRPEALYNRAIAYDNLDQFNQAYYDLKEALELRPEWPPAMKAISNYQVVSKAQVN